MKPQLQLERFSLGVGDRFAHQAKAQLRACALAAQRGVEVIPVWNKSNREHFIIGSDPASTRAAAQAAVQALGWKKPYLGRRPYPAGDGGPLFATRGFLYFGCGRLDWQTR
jgi:hypothetical protein